MERHFTELLYLIKVFYLFFLFIYTNRLTLEQSKLKFKKTSIIFPVKSQVEPKALPFYYPMTWQVIN
jgi:hypothetical protein